MKRTVYFNKSTDDPVTVATKVFRDKGNRFLVSIRENKRSKAFIMTVVDYVGREMRTKYGTFDGSGQNIEYDISMKGFKVRASSSSNKIAVSVS